MADKPTTFSQKLLRLEAVVAELEKPDVELEAGLALLEEGMQLHQECQDLLTKTQTKINRLLDSQASADTEDSVADLATESGRGASLFDAAVETPDSHDDNNGNNDQQLPF